MAARTAISVARQTATLRSITPTRTIPQRELRNNIGEVLRAAQAGTEFTITVHGRPVARLGPPEQRPERRLDVDASTIARLFADTPVDQSFGGDLRELRATENPVDDPWPGV
jgi:prevent-host-death family protein